MIFDISIHIIHNILMIIATFNLVCLHIGCIHVEEKHRNVSYLE